MDVQGRGSRQFSAEDEFTSRLARAVDDAWGAGNRLITSGAGRLRSTSYRRFAPAHALFLGRHPTPVLAAYGSMATARGQFSPVAGPAMVNVGGGEPDLASPRFGQLGQGASLCGQNVRCWLDHGTRGPHRVRGTERHDADQYRGFLPCMPCSVLTGPLVDRVPPASPPRMAGPVMHQRSR